MHLSYFMLLFENNEREAITFDDNNDFYELITV